MGEGVVFWKGFTFEANCGGCGGVVSHPVLWIPQGSSGIYPAAGLEYGTIPGDRLIGIQGELVPGGGTLGLWPGAHQHGRSGDFYPNKRILLILVPLPPCWRYLERVGYGVEHREATLACAVGGGCET